MASYQHIFFDLDHTLWDFETNSKETLRGLFEEYNLQKISTKGFDFFYQKYAFYNRKLWQEYEIGKLSQEDLRVQRFQKALLAIGIDDIKIAYDIGRQYVAICPYKTTLIPHAIEVLTYLKKKQYAIHLITNGFEEVQHIKIKNSKIDQFIEYMITSEQAGSKKPSIGIFQYAFKKVGATSRNSIIIGDSFHADIEGGMNVGMDTVYFNPGKSTYNKKPTYDISCLSELYKIL